MNYAEMAQRIELFWSGPTMHEKGSCCPEQGYPITLPETPDLFLSHRAVVWGYLVYCVFVIFLFHMGDGGGGH